MLERKMTTHNVEGDPDYDGPWVHSMVKCHICGHTHMTVYTAVLECARCEHMNPAPVRLCR